LAKRCGRSSSPRNLRFRLVHQSSRKASSQFAVAKFAVGMSGAMAKREWRSNLARWRIKYHCIDRSSQTRPSRHKLTTQPRSFLRSFASSDLTVLEIRSAVSHSDTWADPSKNAQGLESAAHNGLVAGSSPAGPTNDFNSVRTTKERLDRALRTTRFAPLRTTRFCHPAETMRQSRTVFVFIECPGMKIRAGFFGGLQGQLRRQSYPLLEVHSAAL
jgi:hypothetical protein